MEKIHVSRSEYNIAAFNAVKKMVLEAKGATSSIALFLDDFIKEIEKKRSEPRVRVIKFNEDEIDTVISNLKFISNLNADANSKLKKATDWIKIYVDEIKESEVE